MSALEALTAAILENTAMLRSMTTKTAAAAAATKPAAAAGATKPAAAAAAPADGEKRGRGRPTKPKALTPTQMAEKGREFAESAADDEDEFAARRKLLQITAKKYNVTKFSEIEGEDQDAAIAALEAHLEAYENGADGSEGGDDDTY